jgi:hypothetical protein
MPEALLSRFVSSLEEHPHAVTVPDLEDLFLLVRPGRAGVHELRVQRPTRQFVERVIGRLRSFVQSNASVVTYVPWHSGRMVTTQEGFLTEGTVPRGLQAPSFETDKTLLKHYLRKLLQGNPPEIASEMHHVMDDLFSHRGVIDRLRAERHIRKF